MTTASDLDLPCLSRPLLRIIVVRNYFLCSFHNIVESRRFRSESWHFFLRIWCAIQEKSLIPICGFVCFNWGFRHFQQSFSHNARGVWMRQGAQCSLLERCLIEISCPRYMTWYSSHIILTPGWAFLALLSKCWAPSERTAGTILKYLVWLSRGSNPQPTGHKSEAVPTEPLCGQPRLR